MYLRHIREQFGEVFFAVFISWEDWYDTVQRLSLSLSSRTDWYCGWMNGTKLLSNVMVYKMGGILVGNAIRDLVDNSPITFIGFYKLKTLILKGLLGVVH